MSVEAIAWVLNHAPVESPVSKLVLVALANHAHPDGTAAFPSVKTICRYTCLSERSVRGHLDMLEANGVIERCDQRIVAAYIDRPDRRPVGYNIVMSGVQTVQAVRQRGARDAGNGVQEIPQRGAGDAPKPSYKPPKETLERLVSTFESLLAINTPKGTPKDKPSDAWKRSFTTLLSYGAEADQIEHVMRCTMADDWWAKLVRNPAALVKHWERLSVQFKHAAARSNLGGASESAITMINAMVKIKKPISEITEFINDRPEDERAALNAFLAELTEGVR